MGINTHQDDYYESLFRRTTAAFRAKSEKENPSKGTNAGPQTDKDDIATTSKNSHGQQRILQERNYQKGANKESEKSFETISSKTCHPEKRETNNTSMKLLVEEMVGEILKNKFSNAADRNAKKAVTPKVVRTSDIKNPANIKTVVEDLVNKMLNEKLTGKFDLNAGLISETPLKSVIEDIVNEKLKEQLSKLPQAITVRNLTFESQTMHNKSSLTSKPLSPNVRSQTPENGLNGEKANIKRLPISRTKSPVWQELHDKNKPRPTSAQSVLRPRSPTVSVQSSGRASRSQATKETGVLIRRSASQGRARKPSSSDPVALYQYYKNEWEHFRKQIPGENNHNRLRWHVRQRLLDPE